jgi:hypothetical protein
MCAVGAYLSRRLNERFGIHPLVGDVRVRALPSTAWGALAARRAPSQSVWPAGLGVPLDFISDPRIGVVRDHFASEDDGIRISAVLADGCAGV